jgi:PLP dependent protein
LLSLSQNLAAFKQKLESICISCDRDVSKISLVAVTKNHSAKEINELIQSGVRKIGENRLQEALGKFHDLNKCEKHFIGRIQSNKAREIAQNFDVVQSVSSLKIAQILNDSITKTLPIFLQVNLAREEQKGGFLVEELDKTIEKIYELPHLKIQGLMVMGVLGDLDQTREVFIAANKLNTELGLKNLSMGMSGDWQIAVIAGATHLRIGSLLFE